MVDSIVLQNTSTQERNNGGTKMALFENYERRIDQINAALAKYDIKSIEEAKAICDEKGIDVYNIVKSTQPICLKMLAGLIQ